MRHSVTCRSRLVSCTNLHAGADKVGRYAKRRRDGRHAARRDRLPPRHGGRAYPKRVGNTLDGAPTLTKVIPDWIAHAGEVSQTNTAPQAETNRARRWIVTHAAAMTGPNPRALAIGRRIEAARNKSSLSQQQLAKLVGVSRGAVGQYEIGYTSPRYAVLEAIASVTNVSVEWLLTGDEPDELVKAQTQLEVEALRLLRALGASDQQATLAMMSSLAAQRIKKRT